MPAARKRNKNRPEDIRRHMDWWRKEARTLATSRRATEIRAGDLLNQVLDAIENES